MIGRRTFERGPLNEEFDRLFAFGIDPVDGKLPDDPPSAWPSIDSVLKYNLASRNAIDLLLQEAPLDAERAGCFMSQLSIG